mmetsp:Transcript_8469/g.14288  ORF Transcript_8469/g.14288 Transcript_8469/m.14288 type:complete len:742 (+) Transcript_8469:122-2347(+)
MDRSLVSKATSADEVPTPGYMYNEIARITHASVKDCQNLEEFLLKRLKKDGVHVKLKVLRVIKHCCQHGHATFRREMQRHTAEIKECLGFRGAADPLHGDALNKAVRDMAQEVINAVFDTSNASDQLLSTGRMQGFGCDGGSGGGSGGGCCSGSGCFGSGLSGGVPGEFQPGGFAPKMETGAYSTGRMQGFGNPNYSHKPAESSKVAAFATNMASGISSRISQFREKKADDGYESHGSYGAPNGCASNGTVQGPSVTCSFTAPATGSAPFGGFQPPSSTPAVTLQTAPVYRPGVPGGGWGECASSQPLAASPPAAASAPVLSSPPVRAASKPQPAVAGDYEERLVEEVTAPGGVRASVPREDLRKFCQSCKSLDSRVISQLLQSKLEGAEWQRRLKTMSVVEALVKEGNEDVLEHFRQHAPCVQVQLSSTQASVKEKARKLLELLGVDARGSSDSSTAAATGSVAASMVETASAAAVPAPVENLLDLDDKPPAAHTPDPAPGVVHESVDSSFASALIDACAPEAAPADLFESMQLASPEKSVAQNVAPVGDMFSGMQLSDAPVAQNPVIDASLAAATERSDSSASKTIPAVSLSALEMMMASTPPAQAPKLSAPAQALKLSAGKDAGSAQMLSACTTGVAMNMPSPQMQQMAVMQQQMAMMQQQIMQQQQMLRFGMKMPAGCAAQVGNPAMSIGMPPQGLPPAALSANSSNENAFDFMGTSASSDAFDFVGDEITKNKRAL